MDNIHNDLFQTYTHKKYKYMPGKKVPWTPLSPAPCRYSWRAASICPLREHPCALLIGTGCRTLYICNISYECQQYVYTHVCMYKCICVLLPFALCACILARF